LRSLGVICPHINLAATMIPNAIKRRIMNISDCRNHNKNPQPRRNQKWGGSTLGHGRGQNMVPR
jgi:hypothetical protein